MAAASIRKGKVFSSARRMTYQKKDSDGIVAGHARYYEALATEPHHLSRERGTVSNIGGTARLVSDPPNITVASDAELSYVDFPVVLRPIVIITVFVAVLWLILGEPRPSRRISKRPFSR